MTQRIDTNKAYTALVKIAELHREGDLPFPAYKAAHEVLSLMIENALIAAAKAESELSL